MNVELVVQRFTLLPENLQNQAFDYIEYLISKYLINEDVEQKQNVQEELTPELKTFLEKRLADYRKNPEKVMAWEEMENRLLKKFGYEV